MATRHSYVVAIEFIYRAAADPKEWPSALQAIADCFDDVGANLIYQRDDGSAATIVSPKLQRAHEDYQAGWWRKDIRWTRAQDYAYRSRNGALTDRHIVTDDELDNHEFYTDFQKRHGLRWIASMEVSPEPTVSVAVSVHRGPDKPAYTDEELDDFTNIGRHIEHSLRLSIRLLRAELTNIGLSDALDRVNIKMFVVDDAGLVISANATARQLIGNGVKLLDGHLLVTKSAAQKDLQTKIAAAISNGHRATQTFLPPTVIERDDGRHPIVAHVLPIYSSYHTVLEQVLARAKAVVIMRDLDDPQTADPAIIRDVLGVTLAEARVASLVAKGISPRDAAATLGIKEDTARSALKSVFAKSGLSRQSELSALVGKLAFQLPA